MAFSKETADDALLNCARCCCLCQKFCGVKIELHHIVPVAEGGDDSADNCIPLCFDCHAEIGHYNDGHPKGRKFTPDELKAHRDRWYETARDMMGLARKTQPPVVQNVTGNKNIVAGRDINIAKKFTTRVEVVPDRGGRHITEAEAHRVQQAMQKYTALLKEAELNPNPSGVWKRIYDHFLITTYKEIPFGRVEEALTIIQTATAMIRPKIRRKNPDLWRNQFYTAIYAAANSLGLDKDAVYQFAFDELGLKKPISSLKDLTQRQLQDLDRKMKQRANA